jgi:plasmid stabilization system protein ParE
MIVWSPDAEKDLNNTLDYLEQNWPITVVQDFINNLFNTLDWISKNPLIFNHFKNKDNIRKYVLSQHHTLYFELVDSQVYLLRIFDNRQDPNKLKF